MDGNETSTLKVEVQGNGEAWRVVVSGFDSDKSAQEWAVDHGAEETLPQEGQDKMTSILLSMCGGFGHFRAMLRSDVGLDRDQRGMLAELIDCFEEYLTKTWPRGK